MNRPLSDQDTLYAEWGDIEHRIHEAVEDVLSDSDPIEGPTLPAQIEWAQDMAKVITQDAMRQLDGFTSADFEVELTAERDRYRDAAQIALDALEGYLRGESGLFFPNRAARTAAEALRAAFEQVDEVRPSEPVKSTTDTQEGNDG